MLAEKTNFRASLGAVSERYLLLLCLYALWIFAVSPLYVLRCATAKNGQWMNPWLYSLFQKTKTKTRQYKEERRTEMTVLPSGYLYYFIRTKCLFIQALPKIRTLFIQNVYSSGPYLRFKDHSPPASPGKCKERRPFFRKAVPPKYSSNNLFPKDSFQVETGKQEM